MRRVQGTVELKTARGVAKNDVEVAAQDVNATSPQPPLRASHGFGASLRRKRSNSVLGTAARSSASPATEADPRSSTHCPLFRWWVLMTTPERKPAHPAVFRQRSPQSPATVFSVLLIQKPEAPNWSQHRIASTHQHSISSGTR